jgi:hypothetical protein
MSALLLLLVAGSAGVYFARLVFPMRPDLALLSGPAFLATAWALIVGIAVSRGLTLQILWAPFWSVTTLSSAVGIYFIVRDRSAALLLFILPAAASLILMAPYVVHGFASFPGSWFWDGFAYLAGGESLWRFPRGGDIDSPSLLYQFGHITIRGRFISSALIGVLKGAFPFGGDVQAATGYFLLYCVFTFSCATAMLAKVVFPSRQALQTIFVIVATVSGPLLNLIWANNFDHLLAMSIAPAMLALAFGTGGISYRQFAALGALAAAQFYVYPELAPLFILPAALVLLFRLSNEPGGASKYAAVTICIFVAAIVAAPLFTEMLSFLKNQIVGVFSAPSPGARAGNGLFPTFLNPLCAGGSIFSLYEPFAKCLLTLSGVINFIIGVTGGVVILLALQEYRTRPALVASVVLFTAAIGYFLFVERYDYGSYKICEVAWIPTLTLCALTAANWNGWQRKLAISLALTLVSATAARIVRFDQWVTTKSIDQFSELGDHLPKDQMIAISVADPLALEWASFYLRDYKTVIRSGSLIYYPSPDPTRKPYSSQIKSAVFLVTDTASSANGDLLWSNSRYFVYYIGPPASSAEEANAIPK